MIIIHPAFSSARTFPANGAFTEPQAMLYTALLNAQKQLITLCTEGSRLSILQLHQQSGVLLAHELGRVGLDLGPNAKRLSIVYAHSVGHPVGVGTQTSQRANERAYLTSTTRPA